MANLERVKTRNDVGTIINSHLFNSNIFDEIKTLRKFITALEVRTNPNSTEDEKKKAELVLVEIRELNTKIVEILNNLG
jgi:hypothetical protein